VDVRVKEKDKPGRSGPAAHPRRARDPQTSARCKELIVETQIDAPSKKERVCAEGVPSNDVLLDLLTERDEEQGRGNSGTAEHQALEELHGLEAYVRQGRGRERLR
jgi:hypothetical protein